VTKILVIEESGDLSAAVVSAAVEAEVAEFLGQHADLKTRDGRSRVVRHGHLPEREVMTGIGPVGVRQPRVRDRAAAADDPGRIRFTPALLPPYARRSKSLEALIPILYLKGISTGDFEEALAALLGSEAPGLSASTIARLKEVWVDEHKRWNERDLSSKRYVYMWADGIHLQARLEDDVQCILVIIGATPEGKKELVGFTDGTRESAHDWRALLLDLRRRGLSIAPELAVADGALGFWKALGEVWPKTREQRCWVHKTANMLDKLPKSVQPHAKTVECLTKDRDVLFTFYNYPAEHWSHIRTTNPIESSFATVRHRTRQTKGCGSRLVTLTMVFKLSMEAEKHWRRLNGSQLIVQVMEGKPFIDGVLKEAA